MIRFTQQQLLDLDPCRDGLAFAKSCDFDFAKIYETCERGDWLIWLLRKTNAITKPQAVILACECAEHILAIYEKKHPDDKRPRQAIEAAREWAKNPTEENRVKCRAAAAAAAAAYAADAAAAAATYAADATYAAAAATYAADATYATYAADAATYAADAADAARKSERKWQADKIREIIPNPFK